MSCMLKNITSCTNGKGFLRSFTFDYHNCASISTGNKNQSGATCTELRYENGKMFADKFTRFSCATSEPQDIFYFDAEHYRSGVKSFILMALGKRTTIGS